MQIIKYKKKAKKAEGVALSKKQKAEVKRIIAKDLEEKFLDFSFSNTAMTTVTNAASLTEIPVGNTDNTRVGNKVKLTGVEISFAATYDGGLTVNNNNADCLVALVQWHDIFDPASTFTTNDVYDQSSLGAWIDSTSLHNHNTKSSYSVLKEWRFSLVPPRAGGVLADSSAKIVHKVIRKGFRKFINFTGQSAFEASNHCFLIFGSNSATVANLPGLTGNVRVYYTDA